MPMLFQIKTYLKFLLKSSNHHGIHSPFVYDLLENCFYDTSQKQWYKKLEKYTILLLKNNTAIEIEDFGAGSKKLQQKKRKISGIAKRAGISKKRAQLLGRCIHYFKSENILEIGTSLGIATASMHLANSNSKIITLEGCKKTAEIANTSFKNFNLQNIELIIGNFKDTLPKALSNRTFDLIFFDGNHQKEPTIDYFEQCLKHSHNDSIFIFDDIYWSIGMKEAWNYIIEHPKVTVSIDTYYWGIVFFRKEQPKQHFTIRL
jgi:predicted O-methyltransferase YrrM